MVVRNVGEETKQIMEFLQDFRNEFVEFKQEMTEFKQEMTEFKQEMLEFKQEMLEFRDEVNTRLDKHEELLHQLADSVKVLDSEVKEIKNNQIKFDRRLTSLAGIVSIQQSDIELAHEKILLNERKIAKLEKQLQA